MLLKWSGSLLDALLILNFNENEIGSVVGDILLYKDHVTFI